MEEAADRLAQLVHDQAALLILEGRFTEAGNLYRNLSDTLYNLHPARDVISPKTPSKE